MQLPCLFHFWSTFSNKYMLCYKSAGIKYIQNVANTFNLSSSKNLSFSILKDHQQTTDYTCGPSAVMSLLNYYGKLEDSQMVMLPS